MAEDSHLALPVVEVRRLVDQDVRDIFECLHLGKPPPPHLPFRIVPVGPNGLRLSPPSHEFPGTSTSEDHAVLYHSLLSTIVFAD
jgi:hypothetical protein